MSRFTVVEGAMLFVLACFVSSIGISVYDEVMCPREVAEQLEVDKADIRAFLSATSYDCINIRDSKAVQKQFYSFIDGDFKPDVSAKAARLAKQAETMAALSTGLAVGVAVSK